MPTKKTNAANQKWKDKRESIGNLNLDLQNPRVPKHIKDLNSEVEIRNYLIKYEGVIKIADSIAKNGYHKSVTAIVYDESGQLVVLDGNRRLAACQLLLDPSLAPTEHRNEFENLSKQCNKSAFAKVKITIAPSRKAAEREIWDIHVNALLKPWQVLQKLRMYRNLIEDGELNVVEAAAQYSLSPASFKAELAKLHFFEVLSSQNPQNEEVLLDSGFNKIDRLILGKHGRQYLDYSVTDEGSVIATNPLEHQQKLETLTPYIIKPSKVSAQATQESIRKNVFATLDPKTFSKRGGKKEKGKKSGAKKITVHSKCFVIMPLSGLDDVYESVKSAWKAVFGNKSKIFNQADDTGKGARELIDKKILRNISSSTVVIGVLSMGNKEKLLRDAIPAAKREKVFQKTFPFNPNVALEVGYSVRCAEEGVDTLKDYFLIAENTGRHSAHKYATTHFFDVGHRNIIPYDASNLAKLELDMRECFEHFKDQHKL